MKQLTNITSLLTALVLSIASAQVAGQATSLANLLDLVENDRVAESEEYQARVQEFEQNAARQQEILDTTNQRITTEETDSDALSDEFEANQIILAGFDGYDIDDPRGSEMDEMIGIYQSLNQAVKIISITETKYKIQETSVYSF